MSAEVPKPLTNEAELDALKRFDENIKFANDNDAELKAEYGSAWIAVELGGVIASSADLTDLREQISEVTIDPQARLFRKLAKFGFLENTGFVA